MSIMCSTELKESNAVTSRPNPMAMPRDVAPARTGRRMMWRSDMIVSCENRVDVPRQGAEQLAVAGRRRRLHGDRRRQRQHLAHGLERSRDSGEDRDQPGNDVDVRVMAKNQEREVEKIAVKARETFSHPRTRDIPNGDADQRYGEHDLDVMGGDRHRSIPKGLEKPDLLPFQRNHARQRDVDEESRHQQEDRRHDPPERVELSQLGVQKGMGELILARRRARAPIARQQVVELLDELRAPTCRAGVSRRRC